MSGENEGSQRHKALEAALLLGDENSIRRITSEMQKNRKHRSFADYISDYLEANGLKRGTICEKAIVSAGYGYKILDGTK